METATHARPEAITQGHKQGHTPMMVQYQHLRNSVPEEAVMFFRMGDFYELFFHDAERVAEAMDIALTKRGKFEGKPIPMCGIPVHASESYLRRLIAKGIAVAICEPTESVAQARERGERMQRREVVRLITRGNSPDYAEPKPFGPYQKALDAHTADMAEVQARGESVTLNERLATLAYIEDIRTYWDEGARMFQLEHEGITYDVAAYTMGRQERTEFEFHTFGQTEDGLCAVPSPANLRGCGRACKRLPRGTDIEAAAREALAELVDSMRYRRRREDENVITREDIRTHFVALLKSPVYEGETWQDYIDRGGITDEQLDVLLAKKLGQGSGGGRRDLPCYRHEGSGHRVWLVWRGPLYGGGRKPTIKGAKSIALAREVLETEHGVGNPDNAQMGLF